MNFNLFFTKKHITIIFLIIIVPIMVFKGIEYYHIIDKQTDTPFADFYYQYSATIGAIDKSIIMYEFMNDINEFHPYTPTTALFYLPFILFSYEISALLFMILNFFIIFIIFFISIKFINIKTFNNIEFLFFLILFALFQPLWLNVKVGQINIILSLFVFLVFILYNSNLKHRRIIVSFIISAGFLIKISPIFLLLYFFLKKDWKIIIFTFLWMPFLILFSLLFMNLSEYIYFYNFKLPQYTQDFWITRTLNCKSLYSFLIRIFGHPLEYNLINNFENKIYFPFLIKPLNYFILFLLFITVVYYIKFNNSNYDTEVLIYSQIVLLSQFIYKASWNYTYTNILWTVVILYYIILKYKMYRIFVLYLFSFLLLNITFDFAKVYYPNNLYLIFTSPQLYAKFILFFISHYLILEVNRK